MKRCTIAQGFFSCDLRPTAPIFKHWLSLTKLFNYWPDIALDGYLMVLLLGMRMRRVGGPSRDASMSLMDLTRVRIYQIAWRMPVEKPSGDHCSR